MVTTGTAKRKDWMAWLLSGLPIVFLLFDAGIKFVRPAPVTEAFARLGWPITTAAPLGALLLLCTVLYSIPRTAVLGAIFLTGYLGGAIRRMYAWEIRCSRTFYFPLTLGP